MKKHVSSDLHAEPRRSEGRLPDFRDLIDGALQGVLIHSNFKPLYANVACANLYGYASPEALLALPLIRPLIPADIWPQMEGEYDALIHGKRKAAITRARGLHKDGHEIWLSVTERLINWHGATAVQLCLFDIGEYIALEQRMFDNEQVLRSMLEILPVPIYIARRDDGQLLYVNRKTCLLFQQSVGPLLRRKSTDFYIEKQDREQIRELAETLGDIRDVEVKMRTAEGREFTAELAAHAINYGETPAILVALNDITQRKQLENDLFQQANTDALTGISNRRYFLVQAEQELRRARRFARDLSVMMIDLDHFKPINDKLGHATGDAVLESMVKLALESLRQSDIMGRLGGEEFAVILPETNLVAADDVANRLRQHLAERPIVTVKGAVICTASIGVAQLSGKDSSIDELLCRADEALFRAKEKGRNRVEVAK
ncbi:MAG: sensor domain-containing diguanylate cyclase [Alphaproteobacteria bacterium]|nr:sensor domain-containing diguanylate cyclase [Alphaproteobacteria bacterium]